MISVNGQWAIVHGAVLGGGTLILLVLASYSLLRGHTRRLALVGSGSRDHGGPPPRPGPDLPPDLSQDGGEAVWFARISLALTTSLWAATVVGTYVVFGPYRATPPEGASSTLLEEQFPKAFIESDEQTAWLHTFGMEIKEHVPWMTAFLVTAVAFTAWRYREQVMGDRRLAALVGGSLAVGLLAVGGVAFLGMLVARTAPM
jgi:hypothetical protein